MSSIYFTVHNEDDSSHGVKIFLIFLATSCIGGGVSALWLQVLQNHAERVITWTLKFSIVAFIVASLAAFYDSGMAGKAIGFLNLFFALTIVTYYASVHRSIAFAASNLTAASRILRVFPGVISSAYMALLAQGVWVIVWGVAVVGVLAKAVGHLHDSSTFGNTCFFFMLLRCVGHLILRQSLKHRGTNVFDVMLQLLLVHASCEECGALHYCWSGGRVVVWCARCEHNPASTNTRADDVSRIDLHWITRCCCAECTAHPVALGPAAEGQRQR